MRPALAGSILGALFVAGSGLVWLVADGASAVAVFAGGILPIATSLGSLFIFFALKLDTGSQRKYQRFILINFLVKVVLIGLWTALVIRAMQLPRGPFVASLLVNFFAWHFYEAYRYQRQIMAAHQ